MMRGRFASLHARAICHATEDPAKVEQALRLLVGEADVQRSEAEGHHGNKIEVMEVTLEKDGAIEEALSRLPKECLDEVVGTLQTRLDDSCNLFLRLDKQLAYGGDLCLSKDGDVIAVRIKVRAFPAKRAIAANMIKELVRERTG